MTKNDSNSKNMNKGATNSREKYEPITPDTFLRGLWKENPVFVMLLGMCPVLAVTNSAINAISMGLATTLVLMASASLISMARHLIPKQVRIVTYIVIIASFVTIVDYLIQAISLDLYNALGAFIQLIVANCVILGRAESYASRQKLSATVINSAGMGLGFTLALFSLGSVRELLGAGSLFGVAIMPAGFEPWVVMLLPPGGFFVLGGWLLLFAYVQQRKEQQQRIALEVAHGQ